MSLKIIKFGIKIKIGWIRLKFDVNGTPAYIP
jgi:hypothetical protein